MELRVRETGQVITDGEFRSLYPNTSFPSVLTTDILDEFGVDPVFEGPQAQIISPYEISVRQGIEEINGKWYTKYVAGPIFTEYTDEDGLVHTVQDQKNAYKAIIDKQVAESVRTQRNKLLDDTDWTQSRDVVLDNDADLIIYRQELRDITTQSGFPHNVIWPQKI